VRIARLERLLHSLETSRRAEAHGTGEPSPNEGPSPLDRLREAAAVLQQRAAQPGCDEGDAIAMRALLEEFRSITASLRAEATDLERRLNAIGSAVTEGDDRLKELEEIA
jgi:hypothetical protein